METYQLVSYIAPAAPATRRSATGDVLFLRPEIGFTPNWYRAATGIDFGQQWHTNPAYRRETIIAMRNELKDRFPGTRIGGLGRPDKPMDLLTGTYGCTSVAAIYGIPIIYATDNWPNCEQKYLTDDEVDNLEAPDLNANPFFQELMAQVDWIDANEGRVEGFINWQGVFNNAYRLRGEKLFYNMIDSPQRCRHLFDCICTTMIEAAEQIGERQLESGVTTGFFTVSNCLVNMVSPQQYREFLLPFDRRIGQAFNCIGIHNCAWNADSYIDDYATVPHLGYIDMGLDSNLARAREVFADSRRGLVYTPKDLVNKSLERIRTDLEKIACDYAPCDVIVADIDAGTTDERVLAFLELCSEINFKYGLEKH
ncbi:MAG: uroporphyrinogen decarboxylase family protein [Planctomycetota bacterium]|jgi:hypothetical protein